MTALAEDICIFLLTLVMQGFIICLAITIFIIKELYPHILLKIYCIKCIQGDGEKSNLKGL
jgi:hypothetical protein